MPAVEQARRHRGPAAPSAAREEGEQPPLRRAQTGTAARALETSEQGRVGQARERLQHARMHVRLLAHRDRVAEHLGDLAEHLLPVSYTHLRAHETDSYLV